MIYTEHALQPKTIHTNKASSLQELVIKSAEVSVNARDGRNANG